MLIAKYNIKGGEEGERRKKAEALGPEVVTLSRIAACLPQLTTTIFAKGYGRVNIINTSDFGECPQAISGLSVGIKSTLRTNCYFLLLFKE